MSTAAKKRSKRGGGDGVRGSRQPQLIFGEPAPGLFPSGKKDLAELLVVLAIAGAVASGCYYASGVLTRRPRPFCDSAFDSRLVDSNLCEPCPENGKCHGGVLECFDGYLKHGRVCLEDGEVNQIAKDLANLVEHELCDGYARVLCNEAGKIWVLEDDVMKILDEHMLKENAALGNDTSIFAKRKAKEIVEMNLESRTSGNGDKELKCAEFQAELQKPLSCRARQWMLKHFFFIVMTSVLFAALAWPLWRLYKNHAIASRAEYLFEQVCEILEDNAMRAKSATNGGEPWVVASWLRDHLLLPKERRDTKLWRKVEELLIEDSRIDQYPKLVKGESKIVLEWQVEGGSLGNKIFRKKKTASESRVRSKKDVQFFDGHLGRRKLEVDEATQAI